MKNKTKYRFIRLFSDITRSHLFWGYDFILYQPWVSICIYDIYTFLYISYIQKSVYIFIIYTAIYTVYIHCIWNLEMACIYVYIHCIWDFEILYIYSIYTTLSGAKATCSNIVWLKFPQTNIDFQICIYDIYNFCIYNVYIHCIWNF